MQSAYRSLVRHSRWGSFTSIHRSVLCRNFSSGDNPRPPGSADSSNGSDEKSDNIFSPENTEGLSPTDVSRLRVTYGLLKEHVKALDQNLDGIDPETNPFIDPRSFDVKKLPKLPKEILEHFRRELPPEVAAESRPVSTHGIWEALSTGENDQLNSELKNENAAEWAIVDQRNMDPKQFSRMQRQSFTSTGEVPFRADTLSAMRGKRKKKCPLQDERGRVKVDFRAVGTLTPYLSEGGKIIPKRKTGISAKAQRKISRAIKTARTMALIPREPRAALTYEELVEIEKTLK